MRYDPGYNILATRSWLPDPVYQILATRSWLPDSGFLILVTKSWLLVFVTRSWLPDSGYHVLAIGSWLPDLGYQIPAIRSWLPELGNQMLATMFCFQSDLLIQYLFGVSRWGHLLNTKNQKKSKWVMRANKDTKIKRMSANVTLAKKHEIQSLK